ncbi:MAG: hypothetical protein WKF35_04685 [Ferruginibacter sp.]
MKTFYSCIVIISLVMISAGVSAQHKQYKLTDKRDTINIIDKNNFKQGRWVIHMDELRGEPGFEEEGMYKNGEKSGYWRKYNLNGDLLAVENYRLGGKDGLQQYYSFVGELIREESWRGYNPDAPYDTVAVYGTGSNEIVEYKIVKAAPYSVKNGPWRYYADGRIIKTEEWERNNIVVPNSAAVVASAEKTKPKKIEKTAAMLEWEKKNKGKKKVVRDGSTGM